MVPAFRKHNKRMGKVLVMLCLLLPIMFGIAGLVFDGGLMLSRQRDLQHAVDAAATAAACQLRLGNGASAANVAAQQVVAAGVGSASVNVTVNIPPTSGLFAGIPDHVEVIASSDHHAIFSHLMDAVLHHEVKSRAVAGVQDVTSGAAVVVLDPDPAALTVSGINEVLAAVETVDLVNAAVNQSGVSEIVVGVPVIGIIVNNLLKNSLTNVLGELIDDLWDQVLGTVSLSPLPTLVAGFEVEGLGRLKVDGAVLVNNEWGGEDENGEITGAGPAPPCALACMPLLPTTRVNARDVRVVGGVDNADNYKAFAQGGRSPLQAGKLAVPDPLQQLPVPSSISDPGNVSATIKNPADAVQIALPTALADGLTSGVLAQLSALLKPLFQPLMTPVKETLTKRTLRPRVYNSITVLSPLGGARFEPGIYVIRGTSPVTNMSLCVIGPVEANGVLFYITNSANYSTTTGQPDISDNHENAPANTLASTLPSVLLLPLLSGAHIKGLDDPASPFDGMLIYQRRLDRRPIIIEAQQLLGGGAISGTVYSKWGHVIFIGGMGSYDLRFVAGTMRIVTATTTTLAPTDLLPPAQDVLLLE